MKHRTLIVLVTMLAGGVPAAAQSSLERVEELTRLGRAEDARAALTRWWEEDQRSASRRDLQRALWLRGRLTVDPMQAELDFQRLAVLYPSGQFTPDAILRLAQASYAMGNEEGARRYVDTLARDYPRSEARERAVAWLADAGPVPPPGDTPTRAVGGADADSPTSVRVVRPAEDRPARDAPPSSVERRPEPEASPAGGAPMNYFVQLGAFTDEERAFALHDEMREAGVDVRVVHVDGSRFTHVRVGRFAQREAAVELLDELGARGINAALVRDDRSEEPIGR
jgi:hypothetical protein